MRRFIAAPFFLAPLLLAQQKADPPKPETLVLKPERTIEFTTGEGTWMSVDVSPDGQTLLADLLGDLYTLPAAGGELRPLTSGMEWDCQARYSPDGREIAFISDRNGSDNIWIMNADGSQPRALTKEKKYMFGSPAWSPDGRYVVARRWGVYPDESYLRKSELWMFHTAGGAGIQVVKSDPRLTRVSGPAFSPDGRYLYFSAMAGRFNYNVDLGKWQVHRLDRETGEIHAITSEYGGGLRPLPSPDGKSLLFATRNDSVTGLRVRNLETRGERWLSRRVTRDDQEGFSSEDTLPGYAFSRDGRSVFLSVDGKLQRLDFPSGERREIPFTARVRRDLAPLVKFEDGISDGPLAVKQMRWLQAAPDGGTAVFGGVGKIWIAAGGAAPRRLTSSGDREYSPAVSPDGRWVAYVSWNDRDGGRLWKAPLAGGGPVELSQSPAFYSQPEWSPDGARLAFVMGSVSGWLAADPSETYELRVVSAAGGRSELVTQIPTPSPRLTWSGDGQRIFYNQVRIPQEPSERATSALVSIRPDGLDKKTHVRFPGVVSAVPSPDLQWMLLLRNSNLELAPLPRVGAEPLAWNPDAPAVAVKQITAQGGGSPRWNAAGSAFTYAFTNRLFRLSRDEALRAARPAELQPSVRQIDLTVPRGYARGTLALRNARVVTMRGDEVLERGDILIADNRIAAVGPRGAVSIPSGVRQIDLAGKTVIPGLIDLHSHMRAPSEVFPDSVWPYAANLAYGVTTTRDPSIESERVFPYAEMVEAGEIVGPRIYSTGSPMLASTVKIESLEDARNAVRRYKEQGADYLKQYMQPRRLQRQWIAQAAREAGINLTAEGAGFLKEDLAMVVDGYTGFEHTLPVRVHKDVIELLTRAGTVYTPTLIVAYGGWFGQYYWRQRRDYHGDRKLARFTPHRELDRKTRRRNLLLDEEYFFPEISQDVAAILRAGGSVALGSHGEQQGIGAHWELWMLAMGGMKPIEVLRTATLAGAAALGLDKHLGSIEPGKLADLVVLDRNPLDDIRNSESVRLVIKGGEVFEGDTLNRVWPSPRPFAIPYWQAD